MRATPAHLDEHAPDALQAAWNRHARPPLPPCTSLTPQRKRWCRAALVERPLPAWIDLFERVSRTPHLCGDNRDGWVCTFDWLIKHADNALKVLEGHYDRRSGADRRTVARGSFDRRTEPWACPHTPHCLGRFHCDQQVALAAAKAELRAAAVVS